MYSKRKRYLFFKKIVNLHEVLITYFSAQPEFTKGQIKRVYIQAQLPKTQIKYAFALYMNMGGFREIYKSEDQHKLRQEISDVFFKGESDLIGTDGVSRDFRQEGKFSNSWNSNGGGGWNGLGAGPSSRW